MMMSRPPWYIIFYSTPPLHEMLFHSDTLSDIHSDTFYWFRDNQSLLLLLLKYHRVLGLTQLGIEHISITLEFRMLTSTP